MKKTVRYLIFILAAAAVIFIIYKFQIIRESIGVILTSYIIAFTLVPIHRKLVQKNINKRFAAAFLIVTIFIAFAACFISIIPSILNEGTNITSSIGELQKYGNDVLYKFSSLRSGVLKGIFGNVSSKFNKIVEEYFSGVVQSVIDIFKDSLAISVVPIIVYYFLVDREKIGNMFLVFFKSSHRSMTKKIAKDVDDVLIRYIVSQFILSFIIGICTFAVLVILHVNFPVILSIINAFFNIIPYFGPILGAIPAVLMALLKSRKTAIITALLLYIVQQIEGNIISTKITADSVSIHPLVVIVLLLIGGKIGGFAGMILIVPIGAAVKIIFEDINYYMY